MRPSAVYALPRAQILLPAENEALDGGVYQCHTADSIIMKRKLDSNDVPSTETPNQKEANSRTFEDLKLDPRLLQAVLKEKYLKPTLVQASTIPLALQGRDVLGL